MATKKFFQSLTLTGVVFGFVGWLYVVVAFDANNDLGRLGQPLTTLWQYPHRDTFGALCFGTALISFLIYMIIRDSPSHDSALTVRKTFQSITLTGMVFGLSGWAYIVLNSVIHPHTLTCQLTHFLKYPHEDTFGEICFAVAIISFFVYNLIKDSRFKR